MGTNGSQTGRCAFGYSPVLSMFVLVGLASGTSSGYAASYYVDQTEGSDASNGTTPSSAWKNAPGMDSFTGTAVLRAGDTVYFDRADTWVVTGMQGLYLTGGVTYTGNEWGVGDRATIQAGESLGSAVVRFRDHPTEETVVRGFDINANGKVTNGIEMNHSFYAGPLTGATKRIENVIVHHVSSRASLGQYKYGIIVSNFGGAQGEVANVEILHSVIHDTSRDALPIYPGDTNADCIVRNVLVRGNTVYNTGQDPDYGAGAGIIVKGRVIDAVIESNYITETKGAGVFVNGNESRHYGYGPENIHIRNNIVDVNSSHGSIRIYDGASGKDPKDVKVYGNLVLSNKAGAGFLIGPDLGHVNSLRIYNNTFYNAPVAITNSAASFPEFEFTNNIVYSSTDVPFSSSDRLTEHSNNIYVGNSTLVRYAGKSYSASTLREFEKTSRSVDPGFTDPRALPTGFVRSGLSSTLVPNKNGLSLRRESYGIDGGAVLASQYAVSVNGVSRPSGRGWDVGAYEYPASGSPMAPTNLEARH